MKVYIVRHGEVDHNLKKIYSNIDEDLNKTGIKQSIEIKEKMKKIDYDIVYCSPLKRAKQTAEIINVKNKEIIIDYRLEERNPGNLSGKSIKSTNREEYWGYYSKIRYGTSENIVDFFERVHLFINELKTKNYKKVLVVAHSGVSKAFNGYFNGIPNDGYFLNLGLKNCEIKEYILLD